MTWDNAIPSASFITASTYHPTGTFCWATTMNDLRSLPYTFTSSIIDNNCPAEAIGVYSFRVYVTLDSILTSANGSNANDAISIYPNPSDGNFTIDRFRESHFL